jgi:glycosyltransferase involved in cell wall biosynthesis
MTTTTETGSGAHDVDIREVLRGRDMLCFGHDWSGDPLSKTHVMRVLARDNRILWINSIGYRTPTASARDFKRAVEKLKSIARSFAAPIKEVERNIFVLSPFAVPAYGIPWMRAVNRELLRMQIQRAMKKLRFRRPIDWVFNPTGGVVAGALGEDLVVYYCVDEFTAFSDAGTRSLIEIEDKLLRRADLVVVSSDRLHRSKKPKNPTTVVIRHGVDYAHFRKALDPATQLPADIARLPKPVIGYFGLMAADWIDIDLLEAVARRFPSGSLVLLGKVTTDVSRLASLPNVHLLGRKPFSELPAYSKAFDVGILPFPITEVTLNSNPLKVREYLAAGLPVVSTRIPEVETIGKCIIADDTEGFLRGIEEALKDPGPRAERSEWMKDESWEGKVDELRRHVARLTR